MNERLDRGAGDLRRDLCGYRQCRGGDANKREAKHDRSHLKFSMPISAMSQSHMTGAKEARFLRGRPIVVKRAVPSA
jgi:hypothetical protein